MPAHNGYDQSYPSVLFLPFFLLRIEAGRSDTGLRFQPWDISDMTYVLGHKLPIKNVVSKLRFGQGTHGQHRHSETPSPDV
jgi:hypothetical protein